MTTTDQMLMARIASEAPELRPCLARNPYIYPELLAWLGQLNDSAITRPFVCASSELTPIIRLFET